MKSRLAYINNEGQLETNAPKKVKEAFETFMASTAGQQHANKFMMFKSAGNLAQAQQIIDDVNAGLEIVAQDQAVMSCGLQAYASVSPRRGK